MHTANGYGAVSGKPKLPGSGRDRLAQLANTFNTRSGKVVARNVNDGNFGTSSSARNVGVSVGGVLGASEGDLQSGNQFSYEGRKDDDEHGFAPLPAPSLDVHRFQRASSEMHTSRGGSVRPPPVLAHSGPPTGLRSMKRKRSRSPPLESNAHTNGDEERAVNPFAQLDELAGLPPSAPGIAEDVSDGDSDQDSHGCDRGVDEEDLEEVDVAPRASRSGAQLGRSIAGPSRDGALSTKTLASRPQSRPPMINIDEDEDEDLESYPVARPHPPAPSLFINNRFDQKNSRATGSQPAYAIDIDSNEQFELDGFESEMEMMEGDQFEGMPGRLGERAGGDSSEALMRQMRELDDEISQVEAQLQPLQKLRAQLLYSRSTLQHQLNTSKRDSPPRTTPAAPNKTPVGDGLIDYMPNASVAAAPSSSIEVGGRPASTAEGFEWGGLLRRRMMEVWGIKGFRLCQEGVCNANMDGRDILCIMPTGGGKSLTYQLPALLTPGTTIVISPLISLINDQIAHLRKARVECVMLTGATSRSEQNDAFRRMSEGPGRSGDEIKLCYVTPEKVAKSKTFVSTLEKMNSAGRLARIVIDEAHCCSQLGHDFRPDYKKLSILKNLFPKVSILAVTATLSHKVLPDLLKILRMPKLTDGRAANATGTVHFTAPLYRKNLHYSVVPKPASAKGAIERMAKYIMDAHRGHSGIVYCLSKRDSETVAQGLMDASGGVIRAGVYHSDVDDASKLEVYSRWQRGDIHCICATIAFGLGIDNQNTRYVLHHSMSKSMDGYYQETGRAGRDGEDADCVLFYRPQDANRISAMTMADTDGQAKVYEMLRYAQDLRTCRKLAFARYFSAADSMPSSAWDAGPSDSVSPCGHCDNCTRPPGSISTVDVTVEAWKVLKVVQEVSHEGGRVTLSGLGDLLRGLGGGSFAVQQPPPGGKAPGKSRSGRAEGVIDLKDLVGGKSSLSKENAESLLVDMILNGYLSETYHPTSYTVNIYLQPGPQALRISRLSKEDALGTGSFPVRMEIAFLAHGAGTARKGAVVVGKVGALTKGKGKAPSRKSGTEVSDGTRRSARGRIGKAVIATDQRGDADSDDEESDLTPDVDEGDSDASDEDGQMGSSIDEPTRYNEDELEGDKEDADGDGDVVGDEDEDEDEDMEKVGVDGWGGEGKFF